MSEIPPAPPCTCKTSRAPKMGGGTRHQHIAPGRTLRYFSTILYIYVHISSYIDIYIYIYISIYIYIYICIYIYLYIYIFI
jgi:hypothetical protein